MSTRAFYSSRSGSYNESQGPTGGLRQVKPYAVGHHRLGVANDIFNGVGTLGLVVCLTAHGQQYRWAL
jgi:hypothetical protein